MSRSIFTIVLLFVGLNLHGQTSGSFKYTDSLTYSLYNEKRWDDLIAAGNSSIRTGLDYYYLRMRIGIAYYENKNYVRSAKHFRKALDFNVDDQVALEYLFYSYYFSGHSSQAQSLLPLFYKQNRERIIKESRLKKNHLTIESFYSDAGTQNIITDPGSYFIDSEPGSQIASLYFINNAIYAFHTIRNNFSYFHSFSNLVKDNYLHYFDGTSSVNLSPQRVIQNQYYGSFSIHSKTGWVISPSFHFFTAGYPLLYFTTNGMNKNAGTYNVRTNGYFAGAALSKNLGYIICRAESGYSYINLKKQVQGSASLLVYPLGNADIYLGAKLSVGKELVGNMSDLKIVGGFTAGFSIAHKVWFEFSGLKGDMNNFIEDNGLYIYNSSDKLENKYTGRVIIPINKNGFRVFAGGGISSYSSELIPEDGIISNSANKLNYNSNNFTGGISWDF